MKYSPYSPNQYFTEQEYATMLLTITSRPFRTFINGTLLLILEDKEVYDSRAVVERAIELGYADPQNKQNLITSINNYFLKYLPRAKDGRVYNRPGICFGYHGLHIKHTLGVRLHIPPIRKIRTPFRSPRQITLDHSSKPSFKNWVERLKHLLKEIWVHLNDLPRYLFDNIEGDGQLED